MKPIHPHAAVASSLGAFLLAFAASTAGAQTIESAVNVQLAGKTTTGEYRELRNGDIEERARIVNYRVTNRDLLEEFKAQGLISDIRGWRIVVVRSPDGEREGLFLRHAREDDILLEDFEAIEEFEGNWVENSRWVWTPDDELVSGQMRFEETYLASIDLIAPLSLGTIKWTGSSRIVTLNVNGQSVPTWMDGAIRGDVRAFTDLEALDWESADAEREGLLEGRISYSADRFLRDSNPFAQSQ